MKHIWIEKWVVILLKNAKPYRAIEIVLENGKLPQIEEAFL